MYKLVIFDLDGTLLNTLGDLAAASNYALERLGFPTHEKDEYKLFVGNGIPKLVERMLPEGHSKEDEERTLALFSERYAAHKSDRTVPYNGMKELLTELSISDVISVCNSNKQQEFSKELIDAAFGGIVAEVVGAGSGFAAKPSPDAANELCRKYCPDKSKVLYVGDSSVDMQTAKAAGIDACGVLWGFRSREDLESCSPRYIVENAMELRSIILGEKM
jgi:phosphoglycolate phosphatase